MDEFVRLFASGEALQRLLVCICNNSNASFQYKLSNIISSMSRSTLCIRLTPLGLAPFRNDITMLLPYSMMDSTQLDYLGNLLDRASFAHPNAAHPNAGGGSVGSGGVRAMGLGNEVAVVTMIDGVRVWAESTSEGVPLSHRHAAAAKVRVPKGGLVLFSRGDNVDAWRDEMAQVAREVRFFAGDFCRRILFLRFSPTGGRQGAQGETPGRRHSVAGGYPGNPQGVCGVRVQELHLQGHGDETGDLRYRRADGHARDRVDPEYCRHDRGVYVWGGGGVNDRLVYRLNESEGTPLEADLWGWWLALG